MAIATKSYNPGFLTDEELRAMFCVRIGEFESLLETLRENTGESNQHAIVVGSRGSGKTTLLLRLALETRSDPRALVPVVSDRLRGGELFGEHLWRVLAGVCVPAWPSRSRRTPGRPISGAQWWTYAESATTGYSGNAVSVCSSTSPNEKESAWCSRSRTSTCCSPT